MLLPVRDVFIIFVASECQAFTLRLEVGGHKYKICDNNIEHQLDL
jgi:hypothetical protein